MQGLELAPGWRTTGPWCVDATPAVSCFPPLACPLRTSRVTAAPARRSPSPVAPASCPRFALGLPVAASLLPPTFPPFLSCQTAVSRLCGEVVVWKFVSPFLNPRSRFSAHLRDDSASLTRDGLADSLLESHLVAFGGLLECRIRLSTFESQPAVCKLSELIHL